MRDKKQSENSTRTDTFSGTDWLLVAVALVLIGWALQAMSVVAIPVAFALLTTIIVAPLDTRLKNALPDRIGWLAHLIVMLLLLGVLAVFFGALAFAAQQFLAVTPNLTDQIDRLLPANGAEPQDQAQPATALRDIFGSASNAFGNWLVERGSAIAQTAAAMTGTLVSVIIVVFFIILLLLTELKMWTAKTQSLLGAPNRAELRDIFTSLTQRLRQFLLLRAAIGALQAAVYVGWLALFGIDLLAVWAVLTLVLTFIPNLGSVISGALPVLYVWLTVDLGTAVMVGAGLLVIEQVIGNFVDPVILGNRILLSPAVILVSLLFWGWLWGIAGAFLATPLMLAILISAAHVTSLRPLALVLSNQTSLRDLDAAL